MTVVFGGAEFTLAVDECPFSDPVAGRGMARRSPVPVAPAVLFVTDRVAEVVLPATAAVAGFAPCTAVSVAFPSPFVAGRVPEGVPPAAVVEGCDGLVPVPAGRAVIAAGGRLPSSGTRSGPVFFGAAATVGVVVPLLLDGVAACGFAAVVNTPSD